MATQRMRPEDYGVFFDHDAEDDSDDKPRRPQQQEKFSLACKVRVKGENADMILCDVGGVAKEMWIPHSQIIETTHNPKLEGYADTLIITAWIAKKKGFL